MNSSPTAERRALPASSRNGVSTNSTMCGTLYDEIDSRRNAFTPSSSSKEPSEVCTRAYGTWPRSPEFGSGTGMQALNRALTAGSFEDEYPDPD